MLPAYQRLPPALIAAREDEALTHGQVMYGLIKPTKNMSQIESTAAMVNVIPKKRIYRMENPEEIDLFMAELMKRPLVLQPSAYIGRGFAVIQCAFYTEEERWVMLINQAHPKVFSRIQMGIETAKAKMSRGEPFLLEISFNAYLKRVYFDRLTKAVLDRRFTFIDFEDAEIVIRYPGDRFHRGMQWELKSDNKIRFEFEDLLPSDIIRRTVSAAEGEWRSPALRVIMPDELQRLLPGWSFEDIDPLAGVMSEEEDEDEEEGAVGGMEMSQREVKASAPPMSEGKIVGRARRKAQQTGDRLVVPVELHVPEANGPQMLHPPSMHKNRLPSSDNNYEKLNRQVGAPENPYATKSMQSMGSQHSPRLGNTAESPYEPVNTSGKYGQTVSPYGPSSPRTPHSPVSPISPSSQQTARSPRTPTTPRSSVQSSSQNQRHIHSGSKSPVTPGQAPSFDRYMESVNTRKVQQTYLTDEDDGGFSKYSPKSPQLHSSNMYDSNFNKPGIDRYDGQVVNNQNYHSRDRYGDDQRNETSASPARRPDDLYRSNPSWKGQQLDSDRSGPVPAPRGFHRYQGSGRSDTSASDSGFGENENGVDPSNYRSDRNHGNSVNEVHYMPKTPYYNRGFEQESPEDGSSNVEDIMAKHKAMAAKLLQQQGRSVQSTYKGDKKQEFYNNSNYNKELQKLRQNINDLERTCDAPEVDFSRSRLRVNSNEEPMEESFI